MALPHGVVGQVGQIGGMRAAYRGHSFRAAIVSCL